MRSLCLLVLVAAGFLLAVPARAHMVVTPDDSEAGGWERYTILVPTEKPSATVRVEMKLPNGLNVVAVESKPGWEGKYDPFPIGAAKVGWKGGRIPEGEFLAFEFLAWNPTAARPLRWEGTQWYEDGTSDHWTGDHASTTTLRPAHSGGAHPERHH